MEQTADQEVTTDVVVIGGGLAGLAAAATAARAGATVTVLEGHGLGGRARVDRRGGFTFNRGPRALYLGGPGRQILSDLGVATNRGATAPTEGARGLHGDRLHLLPQGPATLARTTLFGAREKIAFGRRLATLSRVAAPAGQSADQWIATLGMGPIGADTVRALVRLSTYAAATDVIDAASAVAQVQSAVIDGVSYLDGGFQTLVDGLAATARAHGAHISSDTGARTVEPAGRDGRDGARVVAEDGSVLRAGVAVIAAGGPEAATRLIGWRPPSWDRLGPAATAACLELGLRRGPPTRFVLGIDEPLYLSTHAPPADLAPEGGAVVHVMRYQHPHDEVSAENQRAQLRDLAHLAGVRDDDIVEERFLARMVVTGAIPAVGGLGARPPVEVEGRSELLIAGDWVGPVGLLADAALASGADAGHRAAARRAALSVP